jgi:hypothetical protein
MSVFGDSDENYYNSLEFTTLAETIDKNMQRNSLG